MNISVIIPTYNREGTIVKAIESVINQTYPVSEIIVVDDGSSDNTEKVVSAIGDDRIVFFRQPENKGAGAARNRGVTLAKNGMIAFHDSDDVWHKDKIAKQVKYKEEHSEYGLIYSAYVRHFPSSDLVVPDMNEGIRLEGSILPEILYKNSVGTPTVLMEKKIFEDIGGFDESLRCLEDWDMVIRAAQKTEFGFVPEILMDAGYLNDGVTSDQEEYYKARCRMMQKYRNEYLATDTFNKTAEVILAMAYEDNVFEQVKNMLLQSIAT